MSKLIDQLVREQETQAEINGKWYIAKPYNSPSFIAKIKDAIKVLKNKAQAFHYKEDELG